MAAGAAELAPSRSRPRWNLKVQRSEIGDAADPAWATADDRALVAECLAGRRGAFDVIVERHRRQVYQLCYRFAGNHEDASDLAQDAFIRAYRGLARFKGDAAVATWIYRIAVNLCLNHLSSARAKALTIDARDVIDEKGLSADVELLRAERAAVLRAAIAKLPKKQRATLLLRVYHELPHEQIAGMLGSSVGAVKANFFHALANLRKLLKDGAR